MRHVKKIRKTDAGQIKEQDVSLTPPLVSRIFLDVSSILLFFTNSDVVTFKDETFKENL